MIKGKTIPNKDLETSVLNQSLQSLTKCNKASKLRLGPKIHGETPEHKEAGFMLTKAMKMRQKTNSEFLLGIRPTWRKIPTLPHVVSSVIFLCICFLRQKKIS